MAFVCPQCEQSTLEIGPTLQLAPDDVWDEIIFQLAACQHCGIHAAVCYQESRRGNLSDEAWQHTGAVIEPAVYQQFAQGINACPAPGDRRCRCAAHQSVDVEALFPPNKPTFPLIRS